MRTARLDAGLDRGPDVGDVHVDVPLAAGRRVDPDHDEAVAEGGEALVQAGDGVLVGVGEQVLDLAAGAGRRLVRQVLTGVPVPVLTAGQRRPGRLDAGHGRHQRVEHQAESGAAGVDHAGVPEDGELVGGGLQGDAGAVGGGPDDGRQFRRTGVDGGDRGVGTRAGDGEEGALLRVGDRRVRGDGGLLEGAGEGGTVGGGLPGQLVGETAEELGEDGAGVAPGAEHGAAGEDRPGRLRGAGALAVELGDGRLGGEEQVGAGVAVGDREDVEVVEPAAELGQDVDRGSVPLTDRGVIQRLQHGRRVPMRSDRTVDRDGFHARTRPDPARSRGAATPSRRKS